MLFKTFLCFETQWAKPLAFALRYLFFLTPHQEVNAAAALLETRASQDRVAESKACEMKGLLPRAA